MSVLAGVGLTLLGYLACGKYVVISNTQECFIQSLTRHSLVTLSIMCYETKHSLEDNDKCGES